MKKIKLENCCFEPPTESSKADVLVWNTEWCWELVIRMDCGFGDGIGGLMRGKFLVRMVVVVGGRHLAKVTIDWFSRFPCIQIFSIG